MPVTQAMNPKANIKKFTNNDLPFSPQQPVMSSFYAVSTAGQTVIDLSFSVDQTLTDQFFLFVDGKKLRLGASNDYTFTSIGSDNRSAQVTINYALPINLNIQAYQLGLKNESEFGVDARFTQIYEAQSEGFQGFVKTSTMMNATTATGTPAAGTFHSTIIGRAAITDLSQDLGARIGIERILTQEVSALNTEVGPNGERVLTPANDVRGRIRFVGQGWGRIADSNNARLSTQNLNDFVEVTFYGTGLNLLTALGGTTYDYRVSIDGGAEGANILPGTYVNSILFRNTAPNQLVPIASGLTLGVHTIRIRLATAAINLNVYGFELVTSNSTNLVVNPGTGYVQNKKYVSAAQQLSAYNAAVTGTKGGRVVVYQNGSGTIGSVFRATEASTLTLASADHTNEEVARAYSIRDFSASRTANDDFGTEASSAKAYTIDDGSTTLITNSAAINNSGGATAVDTVISTDPSTSAFLQITFTGTGLDAEIAWDAGSSRSFTVSIDGAASVGTITQVTGKRYMQKIVSGLPYGTHTVRFTNATNGQGSFYVARYMVYQPKRPVVPSGVVELSDYNVMANYAIKSTVSSQTISTGVYRKAETREFNYVGTWASLSLNTTTSVNGWNASTTTNGVFVDYTFFGTGVNLNAFATSGTLSVTVTIDGVLYTGAATALGTSATWTAGTSTWVLGSQVGTTLSISGLALGQHTIRVTTLANTSNVFNWNGLDVIAPTHVHADQVANVSQNTSTIGSLSLIDSRKTTPVKESAIVSKNVATAFGVASSPTTSSGSFVVVPDMNVSHTNRTGKIKISYSGRFSNSSTGAGTVLAMFLNSAAVGQAKVITPFGSGTDNSIADFVIVTVPPGTHNITLQWFAGAGSAIATGTSRTLIVEEI